MISTLDNNVRIDHANEAEVLAFANKVREAGGANVLEALLPSAPGSMKTCLIANALNFSCSVYPVYDLRYKRPLSDARADKTWVMELPENLTYSRVVAIAKATGCDVEFVNHVLRYIGKFPRKGYVPALVLPRLIGNSATAFDAGIAFQSLVGYTPKSFEDKYNV